MTSLWTTLQLGETVFATFHVLNHINSRGIIFSDRVPSYVRAGGPKVLAAYNRALESGGATYDKLVKVLLIGQDRVGKTSLVKNLRGLAFNRNERSTNEVEMIPAVKNAGTGPWRNPDALEHTTVFDYKITASMLTGELLTTPAEQSTTEQLSEEQIQEPSSVGGELCVSKVF